MNRPSDSIITSFWCTTVMNVMSWNKVYSIYANETFIQRKLYLCNPSSGHGIRATTISKYIARGWQLSGVPNSSSADASSASDDSSTSDISSASSHGSSSEQFSEVGESSDLRASATSRSQYLDNLFNVTRMLADSKTWQIRLDTNGVKESPSFDSIHEANGWDAHYFNEPIDFQGPSGVGSIGLVRLKSFTYSHPCLRYTHSFGDKDMSSRRSWARRCTEELDRALAEQSSKIEPSVWATFSTSMLSLPADRRDTYRVARRIGNLGLDPAVSQNFQYYDDKLVRWFEWWKKGRLGGFEAVV